MVAVGWCLRGVGLVGGGWGGVVCLGGSGCCWWVIGWGDRVVRLAVRGRWRRWVCGWCVWGVWFDWLVCGFVGGGGLVVVEVRGVLGVSW